MEKYLEETALLNFSHHSIEALIKSKEWDQLNEFDKVQKVYNFVRDEIKFGYNTGDDIQASRILEDGYGQCNTKSTLLMALLRAIEIPNRIHGFTINKALQKGAITGIWYQIAPENILHSWVEVWLDGKWYFLEGVILDRDYISVVQRENRETSGAFCGYGIYTEELQNPAIDWNKNHTFIQRMGINNDFGVFDSPDQFYEKHHQNLNLIKKWFYENVIRHLMNRNVNSIRNKSDVT
ncbi:transglutaminase family protein [bacterium SCSIO 12643]|nr:transglutaminase family protein [bacterium SCSIO 12643]